jgi:hypothetical protein
MAGMSCEYYAVCDQCKSAWMVFRCQAGGMAVSASMRQRPIDFWKWMTAHLDHGIRLCKEGDEPDDVSYADTGSVECP